MIIAAGMVEGLASQAQAGTRFSQMVVFGDSLSDVGNVADTTEADYGIRYPGEDFNYADGRFTDDSNNTPAAQQFQGVWHEQLARLFLGMTPATASLDGGSDYAFGDAETLDGERTVELGNGLSFQVDNMGQQVTNYLGSHAADPGALYIVWGGANDLFMDDSAANVTATAQRETALVRRLAEAGAKTFLIPNLPPLGATPEYSGNASQAAALTQAASSFRDQLNADLNALVTTLKGEKLAVTMYRLDIFTLFTQLAASGGQSYGFTNVADSAQGSNVQADHYLFWDDIHPTTAGHYQTAAEADTLLANGPVIVPTLTRTAASGGGTQANVAFVGFLGRSYRVQSSDDLVSWTTRATITAAAPTGQVGFVDVPPLPGRRFYRVLQP